MADTPVAAAVQAVKEAQAPETPETPKTVPATDNREQEWVRKERQIRKMQQELQAERNRWQQERETEKKRYETDYIPKSKIAEDPLSALTEMGISYDQLTQMLLSGHNSQDPAIKALRAELRAIKEQQNQSAKAAEEATKAQYDQAVKQISNEVKMLVASDSNFESIKQAGMEDAVVELIKQTFETEGTLMDVEEAARQVEEHLLDEAVRLASLSKVQQRLKPSAPSEVAEQSSQPAPQTQSAPKPTLQNKMQASPKRLSDKERRERAMAAFYGKLNT